MAETRPVLSAGTDACTLPSANSAADLVNGREGAVPTLAFHLLGRATLLYGGLYLAGMRKHTIRYSLAGAAAIEAYMMGWMLLQRCRRGWTNPRDIEPALLLSRGEVTFVGVLSAFVVGVGVSLAWREHKNDPFPDAPRLSP